MLSRATGHCPGVEGTQKVVWNRGKWSSCVDIDAGEAVASRRGGDVVPLLVQGMDRWWVRYDSTPVLRVHLQQRQAVTASPRACHWIFPEAFPSPWSCRSQAET